MGRLSLRIGFIETVVRYAGQVGYSVEPPFQGHHYAERACRLILPLARSHGLSELWITCAPDNLPSRRTLERLGMQLVETVTVPDDYPLPEGVSRQKCRYRMSMD
jgi:tagatose 1,6-diphosphate aldolase